MRIAVMMIVVVLAAGATMAAGSDVSGLFAQAERQGRVGLARKTKLVDVRLAQPGEVVVTVISGEGEETRSPPAEPGDMVVRNRCPETGNEEILVTATKFAQRYEGPLGPTDGEGWRPFRPRGIEMLYLIIPEAAGSFTFTAPWGVSMVARAGDAIVRDPKDPADTYRIATAAFACTYEVVRPASLR